MRTFALVIALLGQVQAISTPTAALDVKSKAPVLQIHKNTHEEALKSEHEEQQAPSEVHVSDHEGDKRHVFYAISMGSLASRHQMRLFVSSLKKVGNWQGDIVLVTDKPDCLKKNLAPLLGTKLSSNKHADTYDLDGQSKLMLIKVPDAKGNTRTMKVEKTKVWTNLKKAGIEYPVSSVVYMDSDIVIGKDLSEFMSYVQQLEKKKHAIALFRDTGATAGQLHTGVVVMFPNKANKRCLKAWGEAISDINAVQRADHSGKYALSKLNLLAKTDNMQLNAVMGPDQRALMGTQQCQANHGIKVMPEKFFSLPTAKDLLKDNQPQFVHFTNTHRWHMIKDADKEEFFYGKLGLSKNLDALTNQEGCAHMTEGKGYRSFEEAIEVEANDKAPTYHGPWKTGSSKTGSCPSDASSIKNAEECAEAAHSLGVFHGPVSVNALDNYPGGCSFTGGKVLFNTETGTAHNSPHEFTPLCRRVN